MTQQEYYELYKDYLDTREKYLIAVTTGQKTMEFKGKEVSTSFVYEWIEAQSRILQNANY